MTTQNRTRRGQGIAYVSLFVLLSLVFASCSSIQSLLATQTPTLTSTFTPTSTATLTATPTVTSTATITPSPTITPTPSHTFTPTITPTATVNPKWGILKSKWLTLYFPPDWAILPPRDRACGDPANCILRLSHSPSEKVEIEFLRQPAGVPAIKDVVDADLKSWDNKLFGVKITKASDRLKLLSLTETSVDGLKAMRRLYEYPLVNPATYAITAIQYNYQVMIMKDKDLYIFRMFTTSADEFAKYTEAADGMVNTIVFQK